MKHFYKPGGAWKTECGIEYTIKAVEFRDFKKYRALKWFESLNDLIEYVKSTSEGSQEDDLAEYEADLRQKIKSLGGKPAPRSGIPALEKQLDELEAEQNGSDDN